MDIFWNIFTSTAFLAMLICATVGLLVLWVTILVNDGIGTKIVVSEGKDYVATGVAPRLSSSDWLTRLMPWLAVVFMIAILCLSSAYDQFSMKFVPLHYSSEYAVQKTEKVNAYAAFSNQPVTSRIPMNESSLHTANVFKVKTKSGWTTVNKKVDEDTGNYGVIWKQKVAKKNHYDMKLVTVTPKKEYKNYNGAKTSKLLVITNYAKATKVK